MSRVKTATALIAVFVPTLFYAPSPVWAFLISLVSIIAAHEWGRISGFESFVSWAYAIGMGALTLTIWLLPQREVLMMGLFVLSALFWVIFAPLWLAWRWPRGSLFVRALTGTLVILPTWAALVALREHSPLLLLGVMALVWIADIAAYYTGRRFGRRKLAPAISPGKSWEGIIGAGVALLLYASAVSEAIHGLRAPGSLILAAALFYFSVLGDLFESWMKRQAGIKDSGTILPGHGGVLDRIDALTAALPVAAGVLHFASWANTL